MTVLTLSAAAMMGLTLHSPAKTIPAQLPDPDGKPGDATKPVKVYILAGQSNMCPMGQVSGARSPYDSIYLTADPDAPLGSFVVYRGGNYRIDSLGIYVSADPKAPEGASVSVYKGAYDAAVDYDKAKPVKTETIALGVTKGSLPVSAVQTCVARAFIEVPDSGNYIVGPGYGDSSYNMTELDGKEVYRKNIGEAVVQQKVTLEKGKRYPIKITYYKGGSTAFWMSQKDLLGKGDLEIVTKRDKKFPWLINDKGEWTVRNDVYFYEARINFTGSPLNPTSNGNTIGPELGFGYVMGTHHDEQVLLIKTAIGNRALKFDFRPPSSGRTDPDSEWESLEYRLMIEGVNKTLNNIKDIVPGYKGQGYEIVGFVWWQGHKDAGSTQAEYEGHLVNLIKDLRKDLKAPEMRAAVATVGFGGHNISDEYMEILKAQLAVGDPKKHPEFAGKVASVDTRDFWREAHESPTGVGYHYNKNAETYMLVGDALGRAMAELLGAEAEALPQSPRPQPAAQPASPEPDQEDEAKTQAALKPVILDGMMREYISNPRYQAALLSEASGEKPKRFSQFLRGSMYGLNNYYNAAGVNDHDWHTFGPEMKNGTWDYFSFDPPETKDKEKGGRYRKVTLPTGMDNWFAADFDAKKAGWKKGVAPFGQKGGELIPLGTCQENTCRCGIPPKTLWEKEVILLRQTFKIPPLKAGHRYRIVVGGSAHVNGGDGYALYVDGKLVAESKAGVGKRQGGQPRGGHIYSDFLPEFRDGKVTIAAKSFLRYNHPRTKPYPPSGHLSVWLEEQKIPPLGE